MKKNHVIFAIVTAASAMIAAPVASQVYEYPFQNPELSFH